MSDTPRTDAAEQFMPYFGWQVHADFARNLERALAAATRERDEARTELEVERMRLAACGVIALANTPESAAKARDMLPQYRSASSADVTRAVDQEIQLRAEVERLRAALQEIVEDSDDEGARECAREALAATEPKP